MQTPYDTRLPPHLQALKEEIEGYARGYGLDFYDTIFEVIDAECVGCNLCSLVCPVDECITMVSVDTQRAKMSWSDYQAKMSRGEMQPIPPHP